MPRAGRLVLALPIVVATALPMVAAARPRAEKPAAPVVAPAPEPSTAVPDSRPYDPQLLRLAEVLGALTTMRQLCGAPDAEEWRKRMQALLETEGTPPARKDRLAGAYNRGLEGYGLIYHRCTANARVVIQRFLEESSRLARDIGNRYRTS